MHGVVALGDELPVQLAIDNGQQRFDNDDRPETELLPARLANGGEPRTNQRGTAETGASGEPQQMKGVGLAGGIGWRRIEPVIQNLERRV